MKLIINYFNNDNKNKIRILYWNNENFIWKIDKNNKKLKIINNEIKEFELIKELTIFQKLDIVKL